MYGIKDKFPDLPERISGLRDLAYNLWWSWHPEGRAIFKLLSRTGWYLSNHNPVKMLNQIGKEVYLVGQQEKWSPPLRFEHRFKGAVDAIYHDNYLGIATNDLTRLYKFNQVTDQAWQYSKAM